MSSSFRSTHRRPTTPGPKHACLVGQMDSSSRSVFPLLERDNTSMAVHIKLQAKFSTELVSPSDIARCNNALFPIVLIWPSTRTQRIKKKEGTTSDREARCRKAEQGLGKVGQGRAQLFLPQPLPWRRPSTVRRAGSGCRPEMETIHCSSRFGSVYARERGGENRSALSSREIWASSEQKGSGRGVSE